MTSTAQGSRRKLAKGNIVKDNCTIPESEIWEYEECFNWFDKDGDGFICGIELPVAVRAVGQYWTFSDLRQLAEEYHPQTKVSFSEFLIVCSRKYGASPDMSAMEHAFEVFDRDHTGNVLLEDLRHVISSVGEKLTHREFEELCAISGITYKGGNQTINKQQFMTLFGVTSNHQRNMYQHR